MDSEQQMDKGAIEILCAHDRDRWLGNWTGAPADRLLDIVNDLGLKVAWRPTGYANRGHIDLERMLIVVNSNVKKMSYIGSDVRGIHTFTIAHEVGHFRMHRNEIEADELSSLHEREAEYYAGCFLAPRELLLMEQEVQELIGYRKRGFGPAKKVKALKSALAARYKISPTAMSVRLGQIGVARHHEVASLPKRITKRYSVKKPVTKNEAMKQLHRSLSKFSDFEVRYG